VRQAVISKIEIKNYKSITDVTLELGRVNVFIGENGSGKSNVLEAVALAGAASAEKLDNEFLSSRGIRVTQPLFMRSAFGASSGNDKISIVVTDHSGFAISYNLTNDDQPYSRWESSVQFNRSGKATSSDILELFKRVILAHPDSDQGTVADKIVDQLRKTAAALEARADELEPSKKKQSKSPRTVKVPI
jgi:recombinational DNA repair ATPase RecF